MTTIYIGIGIFVVVGVVLLIKGCIRLWQRKMVRGSLQGLTGLVCISLAGLAIAIAMNLYTYHVFNQEQLVAEVRFEEIGPQYFRIYFSPAQQAAQLFEMRGDEWQVDARILKWHGLATLMGMKTVYRLERISGRYRSVAQEREARRSVHDLAESKGLDLWEWSHKQQRRVPWVDAVYGSAAYMPMANRAQFKITVSNSGLVIRPANEIARKTVESWN